MTELARHYFSVHWVASVVFFPPGVPGLVSRICIPPASSYDHTLESIIVSMSVCVYVRSVRRRSPVCCSTCTRAGCVSMSVCVYVRSVWRRSPVSCSTCTRAGCVSMSVCVYVRCVRRRSPVCCSTCTRSGCVSMSVCVYVRCVWRRSPVSCSTCTRSGCVSMSVCLCVRQVRPAAFASLLQYLYTVRLCQYVCLSVCTSGASGGVRQPAAVPVHGPAGDGRG